MATTTALTSSKSGSTPVDLRPFPILNGKTLSGNIHVHIFSFLGDSVPASKMCARWREQARWTAQSKEMMAMIGDQTKPYAVLKVVSKITSYFSRFPNMHRLNFSGVTLNPTNNASEDLIPLILQKWPHRIDGVAVPRDMANESWNFANRVMRRILLSLPETKEGVKIVTELGLSVDQTDKVNPLAMIESEKIDISNVRKLAVSEDAQSSLKAFTVCPNLEVFGVELITGYQLDLIQKIVTLGTNLKHLYIEGTSRITLASETDKVPSVGIDPKKKTLRHVTFINCIAYTNVIRFFKSVGHPSLQFKCSKNACVILKGDFTLNAADMRALV